MHAFLLFLLLSTVETRASSIGPSGSLIVGNANLSPDGFSRSTTVVNGQLPGPVISAEKGDQFALNVINTLNDSTMIKSTSIHWHGIFQTQSSASDGKVLGAAFVTQCPIAANHSFVYSFKSESQSGTFWYNSGTSTQSCDGLRGPLIIHDSDDPNKSLYYFTDTTVITLMDWYHEASRGVDNGAFFDATLINGQGRFANGPPTPFSIINVAQRLRYRFRLIAMSCGPNWTFSIDRHTMTIIEVDGVAHLPLLVDSLQISAGQRYSFVLNAGQPVGSYWIRAVPDSGPGGLAILRYRGAQQIDPISLATPSQSPLVETNLRPFKATPVPGRPFPGSADLIFTLDIYFDSCLNRYRVNGASYIPPTTPILLQMLRGVSALRPIASVYKAPPNAVVEITIPGGVSGERIPFHLHGHSFHVIKSAGNTSFNFVNPVSRHSTSDSDLHENTGCPRCRCHRDGLAIVFAENSKGVKIGPDGANSKWNELCPIYDSLSPSQM
ncbi:laccase 1 [Mycena rebaudengoi]|nr:laccase 1 [Mycena rebaudengoi]